MFNCYFYYTSLLGIIHAEWMQPKGFPKDTVGNPAGRDKIKTEVATYLKSHAVVKARKNGTDQEEAIAWQLVEGVHLNRVDSGLP
jgi:hypothetical protein